MQGQSVDARFAFGKPGNHARAALERAGKDALLKRMEALRKARARPSRDSQDGNREGPSRWSPERSGEYEPVAHELVVEVSYDHFTDGRFRHGAAFVRWRPGKPPAQCRIEDVQGSGRSAMKILA